MSVVFAYQSLNSNSSKEHSLAASTRQRFQRTAHSNLAGLFPAGSGALKYPTATGVEPHVPVQGPAELVPPAHKDYLESHGNSTAQQREALSMVEGKARQIHQMAFRECHQHCDLVVFGELDVSHSDWSTIPGNAGNQFGISLRDKACQCFSVHGREATHILDEGEGWCAVRYNTVLAVFVHVPNKIAANKDAATKFYSDINSRLLSLEAGGVIDVIMGDTNQPSTGFTPEAASAGTGQGFVDAHGNSSTIMTADTWAKEPVVHGGTNSANSKKFDVAVYNTKTVRSIQVSYFSQFSFIPSQAAAYTDHMGLLVKIDKA